MDNSLSSPGKIILVVEDDESTRYVLWLILSDAVLYSPMLVNDPYQALLVASQRKPDLFLIDYHLPYMNGIELYNKLHIIEGLEEVPAIIMSVMSDQWKQELQDHHLPFLEKPFAIHALLEIVQHSLDNQESYVSHHLKKSESPQRRFPLYHALAITNFVANEDNNSDFA